MKVTDRGYPTVEEAEGLLREGETMNPGAWGDHCRVAGLCAQRIAEAAGMDGEKARVLGMLHDIGRREGVYGIRHAIDGYNFMMEKGYYAVARISLTHSFAIKSLESALGVIDITDAEREFLMDYLENCEYDDYDLLMQVCDAIAMAEGPVDMEVRMGDVKRRYGFYPQDKWDRHMELGRYFQGRAGKPLSEIVKGA
jgi:hypothetical protein